jgi:NAD(P)-dependent dehydrogenase (short-subunit alcohol dehydrogenase family)
MAESALINGLVPQHPTHRLAGRIALIFGAGQTPGRTVGNGKATALLFAREGATVVAVDRDPMAAKDTVDDVTAIGGAAIAVTADICIEEQVQAAVAECVSRFGRIDILHNNVGISVAGHDAAVTDITIESFDTLFAVNLRGMVLTAKHVLPVMRRQGSGSIINISSAAAYTNYPYVGYKTSKAAVVALTEHLAIRNAAYGIRANVICPGQLNTPMAIENRIKKWGITYEDLVAMRDADVPLRHKMGTAWDVANAALFLASDEANFVTGITLPVDGGQSVQVGRPQSAAEKKEEQEIAAAALVGAPSAL